MLVGVDLTLLTSGILLYCLSANHGVDIRSRPLRTGSLSHTFQRS